MKKFLIKIERFGNNKSLSEKTDGTYVVNALSVDEALTTLQKQNENLNLEDYDISVKEFWPTMPFWITKCSKGSYSKAFKSIWLFATTTVLYIEHNYKEGNMNIKGSIDIKKVPTGHKKHMSGAGIHRDKRDRRCRTRSSQINKSIAQQSIWGLIKWKI